MAYKLKSIPLNKKAEVIQTIYIERSNISQTSFDELEKDNNQLIKNIS